MKGIILAGGSGTRLYPISQIVCKQLLPIYDKPLIYYPLSVLMLAGIRQILIISTPKDINKFEELFDNGEKLGLDISYEIQEKPRGLADAFIVGEKFIGKDNVCLILGDNILYGQGMVKMFEELNDNIDGATIFGYYVKEPQHYGVLEFDSNNNVISLEEKPEKPKSNYAVVGLYFYDNEVINIAKSITPSQRGEIEITDVNKVYLNKGKLKTKILSRGYAWLDTGKFDTMLEAAEFIKTIEARQGLKIACIEEIAYVKGFINREQLKNIAIPLLKSGYGEYLLEIIKEEK